MTYRLITVSVLLVLAQGVHIRAQEDWIGPTLEWTPFVLRENGDTVMRWQNGFWIKLYDGEFRMSNNAFNPHSSFYQTGTYKIEKDTLTLVIEEKFRVDDNIGFYFPLDYQLQSGILGDSRDPELAKFIINRSDNAGVSLTSIGYFLYRYRKESDGTIVRRRRTLYSIDPNTEMLMTVAGQDYCWPSEHFMISAKARYERRKARRNKEIKP